MGWGTLSQPWSLAVCRSRRGGGPRQGGEAAPGEMWGSDRGALEARKVFLVRRYEFHSGQVQDVGLKLDRGIMG